MKGQVLDNKCGMAKMLGGSFESVIERTKEVLKTNGFGIISEIDIKKTMKEKLNLEYSKFVILGACIPNLAHEALQIDPAIGLFMPCNVMVRELEGKVEVSAVNPHEMAAPIGNNNLTPVMNKAYEGLKKVIESI